MQFPSKNGKMLIVGGDFEAQFLKRGFGCNVGELKAKKKMILISDNPVTHLRGAV